MHKWFKEHTVKCKFYAYLKLDKYNLAVKHEYDQR